MFDKQLGIGFVAAVVCGVLLTIPACSTSEYEFNPQTAKFERTTVHAVPGSAGHATSKPASLPPKAEAEIETDPGDSGPDLQQQYYKLYLVAAGAGNSLAEAYELEYAPVTKCAELLYLLYPGSGPGGSGQVKYILYNQSSVRKSAYDMVSKLDLPVVIKSSPADTAKQNWAGAIGLIYSSEFPRRVDLQVQKTVHSILAKIINDANSDKQERWAAAIIAGRILKFDSATYSVAENYFTIAETLTEKGSYQAMVARYHQLAIWKIMHSKDSIEQRLDQSLEQYGKYRQSECYQLMATLSRKAR